MSEVTNMSNPCPDCGVPPDNAHLDDCDVQRCTACGGQRASCECEGHDPMAAAWTGDRPTAEYTYSVDEDGADARIIRHDGDGGDYGSFDEAKGAAIDWLEALEGMCRDRIEEIRSCESFEDGLGTGVGGGTEPRGTRGRVVIHIVTGSGWLHTHGMRSLGLPEVEMRDVPAYLAEAAADLLRHVCDRMEETGGRIEAGETMEISPRTALKFVESGPMAGESEDHFEADRLLIVEVEPTCECCGARPGGARS